MIRHGSLLLVLATAVVVSQAGLIVHSAQDYSDGRFYSVRNVPSLPPALDLNAANLTTYATWAAIFALAYIFFVFSGAVFLMSSASSALWQLLTAVCWGIILSAVMRFVFHEHVDALLSSVGAELANWEVHCDRSLVTSRCHEFPSVEALAWTSLGLAALTFIVLTRRKDDHHEATEDDYS